MDKKKLLQERDRIKAKKPKFGRKDCNKKPRIESDVWRKARGCDNKQRLKRKGHKKSPKQGFRSPVEVRGLDDSGLRPTLVFNTSQLEGLDKEAGIIISSVVGDRKRKLILEAAKTAGIAVLNLDATKAIEQIDASLKARKDEKKKEEEEKKAETAKAEKKKSEKVEKADKAAAAKAEHHETKDEDEKKKIENEEKNKVLTMKQ